MDSCSMSSVTSQSSARNAASETDAASEHVLNISCYKFVELDRLQERRTAIRQKANELQLKGTVLLSPEGINLFVAAPKANVGAFVEFLRQDPAFSDLQPKESFNGYQPFNRMLVKVKKEIIAFGVEDVKPFERTSPKLQAAELKQWLDEGRKIHLLDTRNDYEYEVGTFDKAIKLDLDHFRKFPDAVATLPEEMKNEPVVMFCTGGIRCEKAGPFMEQAGFRQIYQLDGGILKYFEEVGGDHWVGECFVFDQRVAVDPRLHETRTTQCFICQEVVSAEDQLLPEYVPGKSCPACYVEPGERLRRLLAKRHQQVAELTATLPGSQEYFNHRPLNVPERFAGMTLIDFLTEWHPQVGREEWLSRIMNALVVPTSRPVRRSRRKKFKHEPLPLSPDRPVREGERFDHLQPGTVEPDVNGKIEFLHEDDELIVINKPAPLPMHPSGRFNRNTLRYMVNSIFHPERPHMVHRLDANTSGVLIMCRRQAGARKIQPQFENRTVSKSYVAKVWGHPDSDQFECNAPLDRQAEEGGIRRIAQSGNGDSALTRFELIRRNADGTSLLRAFPVTGRANQIRAHLWSMGHPICGDPAYLPDGMLGTNNTLRPDDSPMCLHAESIALNDTTGHRRQFSAPLPAWVSE